jgi:hypothetical protein
MLVFGLAAATPVLSAWQPLFCLLALAFPLVKLDKFVLGHVARSERPLVAGRQGEAASISNRESKAGFTYQMWFTSAPTPQMAGLWASAAERTEWTEVLSLTKGHRTAVLDMYACVELLFPEFAPPVTLYMVPGAPTSEMVARKVSQLESVSRIVMRVGKADCWTFGQRSGAWYVRTFRVYGKGIGSSCIKGRSLRTRAPFND